MSASGTGRSHGRSSAVKRSAGSCGYQSSGSTRTTGAVEPAYSRRAASLSSRWRSASGSSADVGPGPPDAAPDDVTTTLCPSSRTIDWGASGGTAKDVSPQQDGAVGGGRLQGVGADEALRGRQHRGVGDAEGAHDLGAAGHRVGVELRAVRRRCGHVEVAVRQGQDRLAGDEGGEAVQPGLRHLGHGLLVVGELLVRRRRRAERGAAGHRRLGRRLGALPVVRLAVLLRLHQRRVGGEAAGRVAGREPGDRGQHGRVDQPADRPRRRTTRRRRAPRRGARRRRGTRSSGVRRTPGRWRCGGPGRGRGRRSPCRGSRPSARRTG